MNKTTRAVYEFLINCNTTGSSTQEASEGIMHSLKKLGIYDFILSGQATDSGGGGTLDALKRTLEEKRLVVNEYRVVSCSLHNVQTCLRQCIQQVYGEGGMIETIQHDKVKKDYKKM